MRTYVVDWCAPTLISPESWQAGDVFPRPPLFTLTLGHRRRRIFHCNFRRNSPFIGVQARLWSIPRWYREKIPRTSEVTHDGDEEKDEHKTTSKYNIYIYSMRRAPFAKCRLRISLCECVYSDVIKCNKIWIRYDSIFTSLFKRVPTSCRTNRSAPATRWYVNII